MSAPAWAIIGGRVVDPATDRDGVADVLIRDGRIAAVGTVDVLGDARRVDATGQIVLPGLIDVHAHLREPGYEAKETIATGTAAAASGGFTTVFCMPNTEPALDRPERLRDLNERIQSDARVRVHPIAAITFDRSGQQAVDFAALTEAGAVGFSDDGDTTSDSAIMRSALEASRRFRRPIMVHCEDKALATGAMHEGEMSRRLGIAGIPAEAEEIVISRDLMLARLTGGWLHVCHVTTGRGSELVARAKADGVTVTAEVTPHHLVMDDAWVGGDRTLHRTDNAIGVSGETGDPNTKVNPPLRPLAETGAMLTALGTGAIDVVATDHAPHTIAEKEGTTFERAAFGMSGFEVALPLMLGLLRAGHFSWRDLADWLSRRPAQLWGLRGGSLAVGSVADLVVVDPEHRWVVSPESLRTRSANTPLLGVEVRGRATLTLVGGDARHGD